MKEDKFIDVEKIISEKNPKALKWMPGFVLRYLKRIIHEKDINEFLAKNKDKKNTEFCHEVVRYLNIKVEVENIERIPKNERICLAMNHPLGGMDAMILVSALDGHRNDLKFIVNDILMNLENLSEIFVGIDKTGKVRGEAHTRVTGLFNSDNTVCIFPAGLVSRKINGKVQDLQWKKAFVTNSKNSDRTIIPIFIEGKLSKFFYGLAKVRKFFGIKVNIEMLYLVNELYKQKNATIKFTIGEPIQHELLHGTKKDRATMEKIRERVYALEK
ncbi:MAG: 1-acyl-sn-glycerol-3-phosphate acyltransferase [Crocinitomicaceae bacterium]|nr:1-acyl-sn-glycerol-3-phosphate acyltransferase [Crocinitomicaceae bacterium]MDG1658769.1 1-acyl-sn-glycerol-3-phosphate acyltransferase [Crocinitomicaceae bacterium]